MVEYDTTNRFPTNTTSDIRLSGLYCGLCGSKTYLSKDGTYRRCPNCDDGY